MDKNPDLYITTEDDEGYSYCALLLTCGHYTKPIYERSSLWDFLHEPFTCDTCGEIRQVNLQIQAEVGAGDWEID